MKNSVGIIDSGYRNQLVFRFQKLNKYVQLDLWGQPKKTEEHNYKIGDRVGQLIILPYPTIELEEVSELNESVRGEAGFGSSGN